jgi:hypothetical protein
MLANNYKILKKVLNGFSKLTKKLYLHKKTLKYKIHFGYKGTTEGIHFKVH